MQEPVGYTLRNGRAEMVDFGALLTNPHVWLQFPHVLFSGIATGAFFVLGISAYHLLKKSEDQVLFQRSFRVAVVYGLVGSVLVGLVGHSQAQHMFESQPMKMAAAEALWETEQPAALSLFTVGNEPERRDVFAIKLPAMMSLLACNNLDCEIQGIKNLQAEYEQTYGPGDYVPPVAVSYWAFRIMMAPGLLMILFALVGLFLVLKGWIDRYPWFLRLLLLSIPLPYIATTAGWVLAEVGRQPWIVFGLMRTEDGVSAGVTGGTVLFSLLAFLLIYALLMIADVYLLSKYARRGPTAGGETPATEVTP
jgi:cytochrome d ubiquinol oxidase subunit I